MNIYKVNFPDFCEKPMPFYFGVKAEENNLQSPLQQDGGMI